MCMEMTVVWQYSRAFGNCRIQNRTSINGFSRNLNVLVIYILIFQHCRIRAHVQKIHRETIQIKTEKILYKAAASFVVQHTYPRTDFS